MRTNKSVTIIMKASVKLLFFCNLLLFTTRTFAQQKDTLTLTDAIRIGLENNFSLRIARNDAQIAQNNNSLGNAGLLPKVDASSSAGGYMYSTRQEAANGQVTENKSYPGRNFSAGLQLSWTLFDGFSMFATKERLSALEDYSSIAYQLRVEDVVAEIMVNYYTLNVEKKLLEIYNEILRLSSDRLKIAREKAAIGTSYQLAVMQAEVDYRTDSAQVLRQQNHINDITIAINKLLGRNPDLQFEIEGGIPDVKIPVMDSIVNKLKTDNKELMLSKINVRIKELALKELKGDRLPRITLSSAYSYNQSFTPEGSIIQNRNLGPSFGVTVGIPIYNGYNLNRSIANAQLVYENQLLNVQLQEVNLIAEALRLLNSLKLSVNLVEIEQKSAQLAKQNADISIEKYRVGLISDLELRDAQIRYLNAEFRYQNALIQAKSAEIALQVLMGRIQLPME